jgi:GDPmannose 4,6-dehydratase
LKKALITGITGQDGSYLAELLLDKGYEVHGLRRRASSFNTSRIDHLLESPQNRDGRLVLHHGDMTDSSSLMQIIGRINPDEVYNLAAQSHVHVSFEEPEYTANTIALGTLRLLETLRILNLNQDTKFYHASTSELFGNTASKSLNESSPFSPVSPYAVAKLYAHQLTQNYRNAYGMFAANGILFNHESPRRGETFVTRKITRALVNIAYGLQDCLYLGNINSMRDWGHAKDYVEAQWLILQHTEPEDFVISTGKQKSVRDFVEVCCSLLGIRLEWNGSDRNETGVDQKGNIIVRVDPRYFRPLEVPNLCGDSRKAQETLGWKPKIDFYDLVEEMINHDVNLVKQKTTSSSKYASPTVKP